MGTKSEACRAANNVTRKIKEHISRKGVWRMRKEIKDSLTRLGMQNIRVLNREGLAEREEKEQVLLSERAHKQVLTLLRGS